MPAMRTIAEFAPHRVFANCGSEAASGRSRTLYTIFRASDRCAGSALKSPLEMRPARSTAPSSEHVGKVDRSSACRTRMPWPPGWAKALRTGASQASQRSLATNSWHLGRWASTASCASDPRARTPWKSAGKRSASRATTTLRAVLVSSREPSSRSTRPRSRESRSMSRNRALPASELLMAAAMSWHVLDRPFCCQHQCPLSGSPLRNSRRPSMRTSAIGGCASR
mmetsp:Transcript_75944/g.226395  ORF Transcript_75944/g.226395 Transcript_75944/m.226395 type:complete len:225 (+) Transcript_75944:211-885(+)